MDWDDLKIFLAIARRGSVRGAADELKVNQSTVSRRIAAFEKSIGTVLFEKLPSGYVITEAGEKILDNVEKIEGQVFSIDRNLFSQKDELSGSLKVAMAVPLASNMLMHDVSLFTKKYPGIELDLAVSAGLTNLSKRETDVAIRVVKIGESPPPYLVGRKVVTYASSSYVARSQVNKNNSWICNTEDETNSHWLKESMLPNIKIRHSIDDLITAMEAVKAGMGMTVLPCCFADLEEDLIRVPSAKVLPGREIWILTHIDLKNTPRVRVFLDFMREAFEQKRELLEGKLPRY